MASDFKTSAASLLLGVSLSACTTVPKTSTLTSGIDMAQISKPVPGTMRAETDPVCIQFYQNVNSYVAAANKQKKSGNFLTSLGLGIVASVATAGIVPAGLGTVGQAAANTAVNTTIQQGGSMVLKGVKPGSNIETKLSDAADETGCPLKFVP